LCLLAVVLLALSGYGSIWAGLVAVTVIAFVVVNSRLLFPWPLTKSKVDKTYPVARRSLWAAVILGTLLATAGAFGSGLIQDWWQAFVLLAATGAVNLLALRFMFMEREGRS
jgi:hypothetical protein